MTRRLAFCACLLSLFVVLTTSTESFAMNDSEIKATDEIKNNPVMMEMLKRIELSKKILAEMQQSQILKQQESQKIQEARIQARTILDADLKNMNSENTKNTPKSAFERFVAGKPAEVHAIYWSMFNYQQEKIKSAQNVRDQILLNGGSIQQALNAYHTESATNRVQIIELNKDYNIKYGNSDAQIQQSFDKQGKLPRSD